MDDTEVSEADFTPQSGGHTSSWDVEGEFTPVYAIVSAVAKETGTDEFELPPLYEAIDSEALNALFQSEPSNPEIQVRFRYAGCDITIDGNGAVHAQSRIEP